MSDELIIPNINVGAPSVSSIKVICRFRPQNQKELEMEYSQDEKNFFTWKSDSSLAIYSLSEKKKYDFTFDRIFEPNTTTQQQIYEESGRAIVDSVWNGYNGTIFAYGQTSSGKTFTMSGILNDPEKEGIIPRMIHHVFHYIVTADRSIEFTVSASMIEIYMENIRDLIEVSDKTLKIRETNKEIFIENLSEHFVSEEGEVYDLLNKGNDNRTVAFTNMNANSSRSHSIVIITIKQENKTDMSKKVGKWYLVDLAGSEKATKTGATGQVLEEAKMINKSLTSLGMVINALTDGKSNHIPYRDSKLTRLLSESWGGNSKTCLIITCSPSPYNEAETISTLRFGMRAKNIKNKPKMNKEVTVEELKKRIVELEKENARSQKRIKQWSDLVHNHNIKLPEEGCLEDNKIENSQSNDTKLSRSSSISIKNTNNMVNNEELKELKNQISELQDKLFEANAQWMLVESEGDELKDEIKDLKEKNDVLEKVNNQIEFKENEFKKQLEQHQEIINQLKQRIKEKDNSFQTKSGDLMTLGEWYIKMVKYVRSLSLAKKPDLNANTINEQEPEKYAKEETWQIMNILQNWTENENKISVFVSKHSYHTSKVAPLTLSPNSSFVSLSIDPLRREYEVICHGNVQQSKSNTSNQNDNISVFDSEKQTWLTTIYQRNEQIKWLQRQKIDIYNKWDLKAATEQNEAISKLLIMETKYKNILTLSIQLIMQISSLNWKMRWKEKHNETKFNENIIWKNEIDGLRKLIKMKDDKLTIYAKELIMRRQKENC